MNAREFKKLGMNQRYRLLKERGEFVGSRVYESYNIHLFVCEGLYVEVWKRVGLNQIHWIEVQKNDEILEEYVKDIDPSNELGLK